MSTFVPAPKSPFVSTTYKAGISTGTPFFWNRPAIVPTDVSPFTWKPAPTPTSLQVPPRTTGTPF